LTSLLDSVGFWKVFLVLFCFVSSGVFLTVCIRIFLLDSGDKSRMQCCLIENCVFHPMCMVD
jgi:hypothetical protein